MSFSPFDPLLVLLIRPSLFVIPVWGHLPAPCNRFLIVPGSFFFFFSRKMEPPREKKEELRQMNPHILSRDPRPLT